MTDDFLNAFRGSFTSALRWHQLDALWQVLRNAPGEEWYVYTPGQTPPERPLHHDELMRFIDEVDLRLREEHDEDYCGIVYADDLHKPAFIKIYDPHNLGVVCGFSDHPPLPGWILSKLKPCDLAVAAETSANGRKWWRRLFGN